MSTAADRASGRPPPGAPPSALGRARDVVRRNLGVGSTLVLLLAYLGVTQDRFFTWDNLDNILRTNAVLFVIAVGLTFVVISLGIDLSVGSLTALGGVLLADLTGAGVPPLLAVALTVLACGAIGAAVNGGLIAYGGFNFFVVTLATMQVFRGVALVISDGTPRSTIEHDLIQQLGDGKLGALSIPVLIAIAVGAVGHVALTYSRFGRTVYAVGGNEAAARLSGVNVRRVRLAVYTISALTAGVAAVMLTGRLTSSQPVSAALNLELSASAAVLLGGASFSGGQGSIVGTAVGVLYIGVIDNGLTIAGVPSYWRGIATGAILVIAIGFDRIRRH
ncbi:ABC transporter permease [Sorangium sp. So ce726]|uniref:ABC transporter permease n=1 Tax=Sorangium sp. So ce726 TaxID=3133319 RepID=UPI003F6329F1